jgi:LmbE family N-acetylglucosaminyl deacetylase
VSDNVLIVAAHPDDETLGAGGTIARHAADGDTVSVLFLSSGAGSRGDATDGEEGARFAAGRNALKRLGVSGLPAYDKMPDNMFDSQPRLPLIKTIEALIEFLGPHIVYVHSPADLNIDHRRTFEAVLTACRPGCSSVKQILCYEVPSATDWAFGQFGSFEPNYFVDITDYEDVKLAALQCYASELRPYPHPRSPEAIKARHAYWGSRAGLRCAEAFRVVRWVR